jgi:hypothetical protein
MQTSPQHQANQRFHVVDELCVSFKEAMIMVTRFKSAHQLGSDKQREGRAYHDLG